MLEVLMIKHPTDEINLKREAVSRLLMQQSGTIKNRMVACISTDDLKLLFHLYDHIFFDNWFRENYKGKLKFSLSKRMTKSAGLTLCPRNMDRIKPEDLIIEIRIGVDFLLQYGLVDRSNTVCGIKTSDSLEALQLIFEHELCHVLEFIHFKRSSCRGKRFRNIAENLFGHTESYHKLPTNRQIAKERLGLNIGDTVSFCFKRERYTGILYSINKMAVVMVRDANGSLMDKKNNRYSRYYVPLTNLERG